MVHATTLADAKKERLEARLTRDQKRQIARAARIKGTSISDFVILSAAEAAMRTIQEQQVLVLRERDQEIFAKALLNPPLPGRRLRAAARLYRERTKS